MIKITYKKMYACICVCVLDLYLRDRHHVINILRHISDIFEPECAGLLNKSGFIWLDVGA